MATGPRSSPRLASWREPSIPLWNYLEGFAQAPSKLGLPVGGAITLDVALKVLIVKSANDVAVMIAEMVAHSEQAFVARMNEEAQRLGMTRTTFTNVNGLPDERQVTTARDLAKLARAIIVEFP